MGVREIFVPHRRKYIKKEKKLMELVMKKLAWLGMGFWMAVLFAGSTVMAAGPTTIDGKEPE